MNYADSVVPLDPQTIPAHLRCRRVRSTSTCRRRRSCERSSAGSISAASANHVTDPERVARRQGQIPDCWSDWKGSAASVVRGDDCGSLARGEWQAERQPSFDALHALLEAQVYRLAFWRVSGEEINYRRFFDINDLVGLRMENPRVFAETHKLIRRLLGDGLIIGMRIDHPDGLLNPCSTSRDCRCCMPPAVLRAETRRPAEDGIEDGSAGGLCRPGR